VDGFVLRNLLVELIRVLDRAVFYTGRTAGARVLQNVPGPSGQSYAKVSSFSFYAVNVSIRQDLYVGVPADLDQFGRKNSYGAVIAGKGLVKLGHMATNGGCLVHQINLETCSSQVEGGLNSADPSADNHHISKTADYEILTDLVLSCPQFFYHFSLSLSSEQTFHGPCLLAGRGVIKDP
jgi:hypothetical protein